MNKISIHAPSRERRCSKRSLNSRLQFQSTLPRGSDRRRAIMFCPMLLFQSTLPRGSDPPKQWSSWECPYFNPRSLAGATTKEADRMPEKIFQSTLPRGSDVKNGSVNNKSRISIHAPSRERPYVRNWTCNRRPYFNPRSLAGATYRSI